MLYSRDGLRPNAALAKKSMELMAEKVMPEVNARTRVGGRNSARRNRSYIRLCMNLEPHVEAARRLHPHHPGKEEAVRR